MRCRRSCRLIALLAIFAVPGCQLPSRDGPVSKSLATCRQLSQQGISAAERGQTKKATELLSKAVEACPIDPEARQNYAESLWQAGTRREAIAQLEEATRLASEDAMLRVRLAQMHLAAGDLVRARRSAEQAIDLNPKLADAWAIRGRIMRADGQLRQSLADYLRALGYAPSDQQLLLETAGLYQQLNQPQRALATLYSLADTYSPGEEPPELLRSIGLVCMALQRREEGAKVFYRLAESEQTAGRPAEAEMAARQALALDPQHQASRELLGRLEMARLPQGPASTRR